MNSPNKTSVGVIGLGTVGSHVARRLVERRENLETRSGARIELTDVADIQFPDSLQDVLSDVTCYEDAFELIENSNCDVVVELIGGLEPAEEVICTALKNGKDVVTANKELLAKRGSRIVDVVERTGSRLRFEASVGGSIPIIRSLREGFVDTNVKAIYGIINGTANYVLTRMEREGQSFEEALSMAQEKGYAEADPTYDIEGDDSAHKVAILAALGFGCRISMDSIHCEGITRITPEILEDARSLGYTIKLLGIAKRTGEGLDVRVHPTMIPEETALSAVRDEYNAVFTKANPLGSSMLYGKGAGGAPTATAIIGDVVSLASRDDTDHAPYYFDENVQLLPTKDIVCRYYLRLMALDQPGVLARVTKILGEHQISIDSVIQHGRSDYDEVPVILTTHRAEEGNMRDAVEQISNLDEIGADPVFLRIEDDFDH
ncbi:MAG: homoserine dehydrogenase [bacterium]